MDRRYIKQLDETISILGYGGMRFPKHEDDSLDFEAAEALLKKAYNMGVNYFDTAVVYHKGDSEKVFARAFKDIDRSTYKLADKMSIWVCESEEDMKALFYRQLETLNTDYIDFYLLHSMNRNHFAKAKEFHTVEFLQEMKRQGKIKHLGFSFHDTEPVLKQILDEYQWDFVQLQLNYLDWKAMHADRLYQMLVDRNLPCMVMEPVRGGYLATLNDECAAPLKAMNPDASLASWAMRFVASLENVAVVLSGMSNEQQVEDNCATFTNFKPLSPEEQKTIAAVTEELCKLNDIPCTGCRYCMDCPMGVDIPEIFSIYTQYKVFGNAQRLVNRMESAEKNGFGVGRCVSCGLCATKCPQQISIPEKLRYIKELCQEEKEKLAKEEAAKA